MRLTFISSFTLVLVLSACGGGSGGDGKSTANVNHSSVHSSSSAAASSMPSIDYSAIKGLYNITSQGDENYLYVSEDGTVTSYNYLGDSVDAGDNCYREAIDSDPNSLWTGQTLKWDSAQRTFYLEVTLSGTPNRLSWAVNDEGTAINRVGMGLISGGGVFLSLPEGRLWFVSSTSLEETVTIEDILSSICQ